MKPLPLPTLSLALACVSAVQLLFASCTGGNTSTGNVPDEPAKVSASDVVVPRSEKGRAPNIDQSTPENVLATIKDIIVTDALDSLRRLCKEGVSTGPPARLMCSIATEDMDQIDKFRTWFSSARLDSAAIVTGDTALLPVTLSPSHPTLERHAFMKMVKSEGSWYLNEMNWKQ